MGLSEEDKKKVEEERKKLEEAKRAEEKKKTEERRLALAATSAPIKRKLEVCIKEVLAICEQGREAIQVTANPQKVLTFKGMFRTLEKYYSKMESLWDELLDLYAVEGFHPLKEDERRYNATRSAYYESYTAYETLLEMEKAKEKSALPSTSSCDHTVPLGDTSITITNDTSLQPIPLPTFDGQILEWPKYRDIFVSLVHENTKLSTIKKFHYLVRSLKGPASTVVSAFKLEERFYDLAWDALKSEFENPRFLATTYLNKLLSFKPIQKGNTESLKRFLTEVSDHVSAFQKLDIRHKTDFILFHLTVRNLDARTREAFEIAHKDVDFPKFDDLSKFIRERVLALQLAENFVENSSTPQRSDDHNKGPNRKQNGNKSHSFVASEGNGNSDQSTGRCSVCNTTPAHNLSHCAKFKEATVEQRLQWVKNWSGCTNCLAVHHKRESCNSKYHCRHPNCSARHHSLLHKKSDSNTSNNSKSPSTKPGDQSTASGSRSDATLASSMHSKILLATAIVEIQDARGIYHHIRLVIDSASQNSFITTRMINRLGLKSSHFKRTISGIGDTPFSGAKGVVNCVIRSRNVGATTLKTTAVVLDDITTYLPNCDLPFELYNRYLKFELADPEFFKASRVDFLLGAELFAEIWTGKVHHIDGGFPKVFSTIFGDVVVGGFPQQPSDEHSTSLFTSMTLDDLHDSLKRFWETEEPCVEVPRNPEDLICEDHFRSSHYRNPQGQYVVRLPFKELPLPELTDSMDTARKMFYSLESKLARNPQLRREYSKFMQEYIDLGHMSPTNVPSKYVIPHHAVVKEDRNQTKLRVVFNASHSTGAGSLNDYLMVGPKLQTNIGLILLNYRVHPIVFSVDIVKFFRGILVDPEDRAYQHVYWRADPSQPLQTYELNTVTYGQRSSPFLSIRTLHALKENEGQDFPEASRILIDDVYVDDFLTGSYSIDSALELQSQLIGIMKRAGLSLSKWTSNCKTILENVECSHDPVAIEMEDEPEPKVKLLGLQWDPNTDCFSYRINVPGPIYTKRAILSEVSKVYDPLGFLTPSVLLMKSFIQDIWKEGLHWDQKISPEMKTKWDLFTSELPNLSKASIPRFVGSEGNCKFQVVGFCDASENGYCATLYLRTIVGEVVSTHLLTAKSKLAPVRTVSIPRLELQAAYLLSQVYKGISPFLDRLPSERLPPIFFSDNSTVLGWLNTPPYRLKTFVANRVSEIIGIIPIGSWRHVSTGDNPSDCGSRGILPSVLVDHHLWWTGPPWLAYLEEQWPLPKISIPRTLPELKSTCLVVTRQSAESFIQWMSQFSSYRRLLRVVAVLARSLSKHNRIVSRMEPLSVCDMKHALVCCVKVLQVHFFVEEAKDPLAKMKKLFGNLSPFLDKDGLWRVGGRLRHSNLSETQKHPVLLPTRSHFVIILVDYYHQLFMHASPSIVQAMIQIRFWIPNLRRIVRQRTAKCLDCFKQNAESKAPKMADLPAVRVQGSRCFSHVGVDFAGPFTMRDSLRRKAQTSKVYLCLFVCMQTKALHLETVTQLSTNAFMAAFDRFISRRGLPSDVYSDSGTNFVGAANLLRHLYVWLRESTTKEDIHRYALEREITWHFNPPLAPHFGGLWESGVRSVKRLMRLSVGDTPLTYEELSTLFTRYEAILNSRPLCPVSSDPEDVDYLTPAHFMVGGNLLAYPEPSLLDCRENRLDRWQLVKRCHQTFWSRWHTEYLSTLQKRVKWTEDRPNLQVGDLVLLKNSSLPVMQWPTARVIEVHPGDDGVVRVVTIRTAARQTYRRPVVQLIPLFPVNSSLTCLQWLVIWAC